MIAVWQNPSSSRSAELEGIYTGRSLFMRGTVDRVLRALAARKMVTMPGSPDAAHQHPKVGRERAEHWVMHHMIRVTKHRGCGSAGYIEIHRTGDHGEMSRSVITAHPRRAFSRFRSGLPIEVGLAWSSLPEAILFHRVWLASPCAA